MYIFSYCIFIGVSKLISCCFESFITMIADTTSITRSVVLSSQDTPKLADHALLKAARTPLASLCLVVLSSQDTPKLIDLALLTAPQTPADSGAHRLCISHYDIIKQKNVGFLSHEFVKETVLKFTP